MKIKIEDSGANSMKPSGFSTFYKSFFTMVMLLSVLAGSVRAAEYVVDKGTSQVKWVAKKVTGQHNGSISFAGGSVVADKNKISGGSFVIDMKTIVNDDMTNEGMKSKLIGHLASDDFFSVAKFPESKMDIKKVTPVSGDEFKFMADLTIKGMTNPVEFNAKVNVTGDLLNAEGIITVNRTLYGIKYGSGSFFQGLGDKMIYDDFTLEFKLSAQKK